MNALCGWVCGMCRQLANGYTRQKVICELPVTNLGNYDFTVRSTLTPPSPLGPSARLGFRCSCAPEETSHRSHVVGERRNPRIPLSSPPRGLLQGTNPKNRLPSRLKDEFRAANVVAAALLQRMSRKQRVAFRRLDDGLESDPVMLFTNEEMRAVVFPNAEILPQVRGRPPSPTAVEREWSWWDHTGGGKADAFKPPRVMPFELNTVPC